MTDPRGRGGALVPLSQARSFEPGANTPENARQYRTREVELTPAGREKADAFETYNPQHNPRMRCETTSILFDWTYDGAVNRITQTVDTVTLEYGQLGFTRTIHLNMTEHRRPSSPRARVTRSAAGRKTCSSSTPSASRPACCRRRFCTRIGCASSNASRSIRPGLRSCGAT